MGEGQGEEGERRVKRRGEGWAEKGGSREESISMR